MEGAADNLTSEQQVYRSACRMCHGGCGVIVYVKNGVVTDIKGDPESPVNKGRLCIKGLASLEHLYHPDRLKYPLRRVGERGDGKWKRITWDEALDLITTQVNNIRDDYGVESVCMVQGTARHHFHHTLRFTNALGTPNWIEAGAAQCFFPRVRMSEITYGCLPVCDYYGDVNPGCVLVWGHNPIITGPDCESQFKVRDCLRKGTKLIVIDPRRTEMAEKADLWLQVRPGTDAALALGMLNVIINEELYDKKFVANWTVGFEPLRDRVQDYFTEKVEQITWVPAEKIKQAARLFAKTKPATLEWGVGLEHTPNSFQTVRAVGLLPGITGNFDIPGGWIEGMGLLPEPDLLFDLLPREQREKRFGGQSYKFLSGADFDFTSTHVPTVLEAIRTGKPYPVKAMLVFGNNGLVGFANTRDVYETISQVDFLSVMDIYMTPTAELADLVLPAATWLEVDQLLGVPFLASHIALAQQKIVSYEECWPDEEVFLELAKRLGLDYRADSVTEILNQQLIELASNYPEFEGINFGKLKDAGYIQTEIKYKKYEKKGFATPSGKVELCSSLMEKYGYDPLPYHQEPPETPYSAPETAEEYPLILITGGRVQHYFHTEFLQLPSLRRKHPDPLVDIHPETAAIYDIREDDWVWIETKRGRIRQKARLTDGINPRVINCQHGWWYPEDPSPEHGVWKSNANVLTNNKPPYDPQMGTYQLRSLLCKIYRET